MALYEFLWAEIIAAGLSLLLIFGGGVALLIPSMSALRKKDTMPLVSESGSESESEPESEDPLVCTVTLPSWTSSHKIPDHFGSPEEKMSFVIQLSATNVAEKTGGPFAAAIFRGGTLLGFGTNRVLPSNNCTLHAEMVAIMGAQRALGHYTLNSGTTEGDGCELYSSCEPCCMCLGATLWSGVTSLVCGAAKNDAQSAGFDEGPVYDSSYEHLKNAGISIRRGFMRMEAAAVLRDYGREGFIYNR